MHLVDKEKINRSLSTKIVDARVTQVFNSFENVLVTSSFGATSAVLLHLVSRIKPACPIYFIDTGYHFEETLEYKERMSRLLNLNVVNLKPDPSRHMTTQVKQLWAKNPDRCCHINKIEPLEKVKPKFNVWMSGLIGYQNKHRSNLEIIDDKSEMLKFYPLIDWNRDLVDEYIDGHGIPKHPLAEKGFNSIGCTHCTIAGNGREGRWNGHSKTECGLHK